MQQYETKAIFAHNLNRLLRLAGETQVDLIRALGVSKSTVSSWCAGDKMPRMDKIEALARHFDVPKSTLLEQDRAPDVPPDNFLAAFFRESRGLNDDNKQKLLEMARFFKQIQEKETANS